MLAFLYSITVTQLIAHLIGDYLLQSTWMAENKVKRISVAAVHSLVYSLPFVVIFQPTLLAWMVIVGTHIFIDRYRLARYACWLRNWLCPFWIERPAPWGKCTKTGFNEHTPDYIAVWLLIITDNVIHMLINGAALFYLI